MPTGNAPRRSPGIFFDIVPLSQQAGRIVVDRAPDDVCINRFDDDRTQ